MLNEISKIENLERRVSVSNRNKCGRSRNKWNRIVNKVHSDLIGDKQKNPQYMNLERETETERDTERQRETEVG